MKSLLLVLGLLPIHAAAVQNPPAVARSYQCAIYKIYAVTDAVSCEQNYCTREEGPFHAQSAPYPENGGAAPRLSYDDWDISYSAEAGPAGVLLRVGYNKLWRPSDPEHSGSDYLSNSRFFPTSSATLPLEVEPTGFREGDLVRLKLACAVR